MTTVSEEAEAERQREKDAVISMRNAKANMELSLARIATLERALRNAIAAIKYGKSMISPNTYTYPGNREQTTVHARIDQHIADAQKDL